MKLTEKTIDIISYLGKNGIKKPPIERQMAKNLKMCYAYTNKLVKNLIKEGLVYKEEKKGRTKKIHLTDKGKKLFKEINEGGFE
jgi:DNA-binding MarR family transcriptional regulator